MISSLWHLKGRSGKGEPPIFIDVSMPDDPSGVEVVTTTDLPERAKTFFESAAAIRYAQDLNTDIRWEHKEVNIKVTFIDRKF
jgi:hypothetical protein